MSDLGAGKAADADGRWSGGVGLPAAGVSRDSATVPVHPGQARDWAVTIAAVG